jgi:hypothetical protein
MAEYAMFIIDQKDFDNRVDSTTAFDSIRSRIKNFSERLNDDGLIHQVGEDNGEVSGKNELEMVQNLVFIACRFGAIHFKHENR